MADVNRIPAELGRGVRIGSIPAFRAPDELTPGEFTANLNGLEVGLRWVYGDIAAVIFTHAIIARTWPGFEVD